MVHVCVRQGDQEKLIFLDELRDVRVSCQDTWVVWGDFNLIYQAADKNNQRLNRRLMNSFRVLLGEVELQELHLKVGCSLGPMIVTTQHWNALIVCLLQRSGFQLFWTMSYLH